MFIDNIDKMREQIIIIKGMGVDKISIFGGKVALLNNVETMSQYPSMATIHYTYKYYHDLIASDVDNI